VNIHRAYLGVQVAGSGDGEGAVVYSVDPGGPADQAGVRPNDIITSIGGRSISDQPSLAAALAALESGQSVDLRIRRADGSTVTLTVTLGELSG
jgi:putative serine protease PepD